MCPGPRYLEKAEFDQFVWRGEDGMRFANRIYRGGLFPQRHWPVFRRAPREFRRKRYPFVRMFTARVVRAIEKAARVSAARRWIPINPLLQHLLRVEDAVHGRANRLAL